MRVRIALISTLLTLAVTAVQTHAAQQWQPKEIIRTFWCEPPADDTHLATLKKEHFTLTWCPANALDTVARHGLRGMIHDETILKPWCLDDPVKRKKLDETIAAVKNHPALDGYWIADEPWKIGEIQYLGRLTKYIRERDPAHFTYINALPNFALGTPAYEKYMQAYFEELQPQICSFDYYPFRNGYDLITYFENLEVIKKYTNKYDVPWVSIVQANTIEKDWRLPTPSELRWLVYINLAYGAKGISYFTYWGPKKFNGLYADGVRMPIVDSVVQLNKEMASLSKVLMPLQCENVTHTAPVPLGTHEIPKDARFQIPSRGHGQFMISQFVNPKSNQKYVMVVNRDYRAAHEAKLKLNGAALECEYDRSKGTFTAAPQPDWSGTVPIKLTAGDARLFAYSEL